MGSNQSAGHTILVVEDTADTRALLCIWLRSRGYIVVEAGDGPEAVEVARRERPDLVMMDISLPTFDGLTIRTDHGHEFQARFYWHVEDLGINHTYIRVRTPRLNGKVERSHRTDTVEFYQHSPLKSHPRPHTR